MATTPIMLRLARPFQAAARQQLLSRGAVPQRRHFAERKDNVLSSDPAFLPGSQSKAVPVKTEVPGAPTTVTPATPVTPTSASAIPPENIPKTPPSPSDVQATPPTVIRAPPPSTATPPPLPPPSSTSQSSPPPPPSQPPAPKPRRRFSFFRSLLYLIILSALGYSAAVWYALRNDNFHDFFTEYVFFGEDIVLYFEEREFQKRFPHAKREGGVTQTRPTNNNDASVTIPFKSGLSWKVTDEENKSGSDLTTKGKHMSAVDANAPSKQETSHAGQDPGGATTREGSSAVDKAKTDAAAKGKSSGSKPADAKPTESKPETKPKPAETKPEPAKKEATVPPSPAAQSPKEDPRPPVVAPVTQISPLQVANADEPVVQELVKIINDLITVLNSDNADVANKYSQPMQKAKDSMQSVAKHINEVKESERKAAEERLAQAHKEFEEGARQLLQRIETAQKEDATRFAEEFEAERAKLAQQFDDKVKAEAESQQKLYDQRIKNELTEQAIELRRKFTDDIQSLVETEREGRLSKLSDLSSNVENLSELTSNWNGVIDSNLHTQQLQVAVDAVRSAISAANATHKPQPFVREMAALKLVAENDGIVDAAIASINPSTYQRGLPSPAQLIDRFRRVADEVRKASLLPENAGVASHAASYVLSQVMFKKQGQPQGGDVESVLTRAETLLEEGDLDGAAREMTDLKGWAGVLSKDWLGDVRKVLEVNQALEVIETEAKLQCLRVS